MSTSRVVNRTGVFITLEGGEGSGKSSVCRRLESLLSAAGYSVKTTHEPGGTPLGQEIRHCLLGKDFKASIDAEAEVLLFLADRSQHLSETIRPALSRGELILCDRFNDSTLAYQGYGRGLDLDWLRQLCQLTTKDCRPSLTLLLDIDPVIGLERAARARARDRLELEAIEFHKRVRQGFLVLAKAEPERIRVIDASQSLAEVVAQAFQEVKWKL